MVSRVECTPLWRIAWVIRASRHLVDQDDRLSSTRFAFEFKCRPLDSANG